MFKSKKAVARKRPVKNEDQASKPSVFSYHASRLGLVQQGGRNPKADDSPVKARRIPKKSWLKRTTQTLLLILLICLAIVNLSITNNPRVVVEGGDANAEGYLREVGDYQQAAHELLAESILNTNKVTIDTAKVSAILMNEFPELASVSIALPVIGRQPVLNIKPSKSTLIINTSGGASYILNGSGKAIASGRHVAALKKAGLPQVNDESGLDISLGSSVLPSTNVAFITEVVRQFKAKGIQVEQMSLPVGAPELRLKTVGSSYFVKFNLRGDAREEAGAFLATKQHLEASGKTPVEYVDVRIDNRVYYK